MKPLLLSVLIFLSSVSLTYAKMGVILIHELKSSNTLRVDKHVPASLEISIDYWKSWLQNAFKNIEAKHLIFDSKKRINENIAIMAVTAKAIIKKGHCDDGCVVFTQSTGGLVVEKLMAASRESRGTGERKLSLVVDGKGASRDFQNARMRQAGVHDESLVRLATQHLAEYLQGGLCTDIELEYRRIRKFNDA